MATKRHRSSDGGKGGGKGKKRKQAAENSEEGERGFLITGPTCQNALRGAKDLRLWLEVESPEESAVTAAGAAQGLDAELAQLRAEGTPERRFLSVGMVCKQVAFLKTQHATDVPSSLARRFCPSDAKRRFTSRFAERVLPVDASARPKLERFDQLASELLAPRTGTTWRLEYEAFRGGWNTISQEDALRACKRTLGAEALSVTAPEITVLCTVQPRFVGLAVLEMDVEQLRVEE